MARRDVAWCYFRDCGGYREPLLGPTREWLRSLRKLAAKQGRKPSPIFRIEPPKPKPKSGRAGR